MIRKTIFVLVCLISTTAKADTIGSTISSTCWSMGTSHVAATNCIVSALKGFEKKLTNLESSMLEKAKAFDKDFHARPSLVKTHKESNDAFRIFIEKECEKMLISYSGGSSAGDFYTVCKIDLIAQRIKYLKNIEG